MNSSEITDRQIIEWTLADAPQKIKKEFAEKGHPTEWVDKSLLQAQDNWESCYWSKLYNRYIFIPQHEKTFVYVFQAKLPEHYIGALNAQKLDKEIGDLLATPQAQNKKQLR